MERFGKKGVSLIELTITMVQLSIIATVFHTTIGGTLDSWNGFSSRREALLKGQKIVNHIRFDVNEKIYRGGVSNLGTVGRAGVPCSDTALTYFNASGTEVRFYFATGSFQGLPEDTYFVREVTGGGGTTFPFVSSGEIQSLVFRYFDWQSREITVSGGGLTAGQARDVAFIRVELEMESGSSPVILTTAASPGGDYVTAY